jgi:hypothetical protein
MGAAIRQPSSASAPASCSKSLILTAAQIGIAMRPE